MADPLFVTDTVEGLGLDRPLTANEIDLNNIAWLLRMRAAEAALLASGGGIVNIEQTDDRLVVITLADASTYTILMPLARPSPRGEWQNNTVYMAYDWVTVRGIGTFVANVGHTSPLAPALFDPLALGESDELLWTLVGGRSAYTPGFPYIYNSAIVEPASGEITFNTATLSDAVQMYIHYSSDDAANMENLIVAWGEQRGRFMLFDASDTENFVIFDIVGTLVDNSTYATIPVAQVMSAGVLPHGTMFAVQFSNGGNSTSLPVDVSTTTHSPDMSSANKYHRCTNPAGCTVTVPTDSAFDHAIGTELHYRHCAETDFPVVVTDSFIPTINGIEGYLKQTRVKGAVISLKKVAVNIWDLWGLLADDTDGGSA